MQAGLMGLHAAAKNYDQSSIKFNTYATYYILGEIRKEMRNGTRSPFKSDLQNHPLPAGQ